MTDDRRDAPREPVRPGRGLCSWLLAGVAILTLPTPRTAFDPATPGPRTEVRGITVSTPGSGRDWGSDAIGPCFDELSGLGANWIAIHPYAAIRADGTVRSRLDPASPPEYLTRPIREAHERGLKILIKPHLAYWGSPFRWRGEIDFGEDEAAWQRFWRGYEAWILDLAAIARDADAFCIGTELDRTLRFESRWRSLIANVRERSDAALSYAANWTDYRDVGFWDALDCIGIQAYFPVCDERTEDRARLESGWRALMAELREFSRAHGRRICFTELGYNRSFDAPVRPWDYRQDGEEALAVQATCLDVALRAIEDEPCVVGAFLWKWFPRELPRDHDFKLQTTTLRAVLREAWSSRD
jgi:hypothetical protein